MRIGGLVRTRLKGRRIEPQKWPTSILIFSYKISFNPLIRDERLGAYTMEYLCAACVRFWHLHIRFTWLRFPSFHFGLCFKSLHFQVHFHNIHVNERPKRRQMSAFLPENVVV